MSNKGTEKTKEKVIIGKWWLPNNPRKKLRGELTIKKHSYELMVEGKFLQSERESQIVNIILGEDTETGYEFTLENCRVIQHTGVRNYKPSYYCQIWPEYVYSLAHLNGGLKFREYTIQLDCVLPWTRKMAIESEHTKDGMIVHYKKPDDIVIFDNEQLKVIIEFDNDPLSGLGRYSIKLTQLANIKVIFEEPQHTEGASAILNHIAKFFSFASNKMVFPSVITVKKLKLSKREPALSYARVYSRLIATGESETFNESEALFSIVNPKFEPIVCNAFRLWMEKQSGLTPIIDLYLTHIFNRDVYIDYKFISIIQALEAYHRHFHDNNLISPEEYSKYIPLLKKHIKREINNPAIRQSIYERLNYGYEKNLKDKVLDLIALLPTTHIDSYISMDRNDFAKRAALLRNELTHPDPASVNPVSRWDIGLVLYQKVKFLMQYLLLLELGFTNDAIEEYLIDYTKSHSPYVGWFDLANPKDIQRLTT